MRTRGSASCCGGVRITVRPRRVRREMKKRWRKVRARNAVSPSAARRYLGAFHDESQEKLRVAGKALIPEANGHLLGLGRVNGEFVGFVQGCSQQMLATLDVSREFKTAVEAVDEDDWHRVYKEVDGNEVETDRQWAEVCFVPNAIAFSSKAPVYRYLATREALKDRVLPGMESEQTSLPFQTMNRDGVTYKVFGVVTNLGWEGSDVIRFHDGRCGKQDNYT